MAGENCDDAIEIKCVGSCWSGVEPPPITEKPGRVSIADACVCECEAKFGGESFRAMGDFGGRGANHAEGWNFVERAAKVCVQRDFECGDREFIDAQRAEERIAADAVDEFAFAGDDAGLWTAEKFVAAEADNVDAGVGAGARDWLIDSAGGKIGEAAGAEVLVDGDVQAAAERCDLVESGPLGEAGDAEIRRVDAEEEARALVEGAFVIADARAIRGAHFAQDGAAFGHDVWNAEAVADFDQLAAGDDDFGIFRERIQDEENGGGVVVDDDRGLRANELRQQAGGVNVALAALASFDVVFEIRIVSGGGGNRSRCSGGEWGAAKICMQDYTCGVDDVGERGREEEFDVFYDARLDGGGIQCGGEIARARGVRGVRG